MAMPRVLPSVLVQRSSVPSSTKTVVLSRLEVGNESATPRDGGRHRWIGDLWIGREFACLYELAFKSLSRANMGLPASETIQRS